jgi:serine/threonine protein kinase
VGEDWEVKLADYHNCRFVTGDKPNLSSLGQLRGSYAYCAPEIYFGKEFSPQSDIYSLGVILWEAVHRCLTGKYQEPYAEYSQIVFDFQMVVHSAKHDKRPTISATCPGPVASLIQRCWSKMVEERPTLDEVSLILNELDDLYVENQTQWDALLS